MTSIIIASIHLEKLKTCMESIKKNTACPYEVIVVGKEYPAAKAIDKGLLMANGEYAVVYQDYLESTPGWLENMLAFLKDKKKTVGIFNTFYPHGEMMPVPSIHGVFPYGYTVCCKRGYMLKLGGWSGGFDHYYSDPDFAMRVYKDGGKMAVCDTAWVITHRDNKPAGDTGAVRSARQEFYRRWGWKIKFAEIRREIW